MNDTIGFMYDDETAVRFAAHTTGLDEPTCAAVLHSRDRYQLGLGMLPPDLAEGLGASAESIREILPALFPPEHMASRYVLPAYERAFVVQDAKLDERIVRAVLDADLMYMRRLGIAVAC